MCPRALRSSETSRSVRTIVRVCVPRPISPRWCRQTNPGSAWSGSGRVVRPETLQASCRSPLQADPLRGDVVIRKKCRILAQSVRTRAGVSRLSRPPPACPQIGSRGWLRASLCAPTHQTGVTSCRRRRSPLRPCRAHWRRLTQPVDLETRILSLERKASCACTRRLWN
jgi:hypothetical protein